MRSLITGGRVREPRRGAGLRDRGAPVAAGCGRSRGPLPAGGWPRWHGRDDFPVSGEPAGGGLDVARDDRRGEPASSGASEGRPRFARAPARHAPPARSPATRTEPDNLNARRTSHRSSARRKSCQKSCEDAAAGIRNGHHHSTGISCGTGTGSAGTCRGSAVLTASGDQTPGAVRRSGQDNLRAPVSRCMMMLGGWPAGKHGAGHREGDVAPGTANQAPASARRDAGAKAPLAAVSSSPRASFPCRWARRPAAWACRPG